MNDEEAIEELAGYIFAYELDRPSIPVADALAKKLYELGYRKTNFDRATGHGHDDDFLDDDDCLNEDNL